MRSLKSKKTCQKLWHYGKFIVYLQALMNVAILQHDILWQQPEENLQRLTTLLEQHHGADLYVLTETFSTGFLSDASETDGTASLLFLRQQARTHDAAFAASIAMRDAEGYLRNRLYFVRPDSSYDYYDKRHLFSYAGENNHFLAGDHRVITEWRGVRFLLQICYDLRFPVWSRNLNDYDAIIYVANWPTSRIDVWQTLLKARALENQCFVIATNRIGQDPACQYSGGSMVLDAYGHTLCSCPDHQECLRSVSLDMQRLQTFRNKFPVLNDRDVITLNTKQ